LKHLEKNSLDLKSIISWILVSITYLGWH